MHVVGTGPDESDSLHASVGETRVARELGQTLDRVLERVYHDGKVSCVQVVCKPTEIS